MIGTTLYPLNELKDKYPEIYAEEIKKYNGREPLLKATIPPLNCLWNDVLHLTAVSPVTLRDALAQANLHYDPIIAFKIPISILKKEDCIVFTYRRDKGLIPDLKEYENFAENKIEIYSKIPPETIEYYKEQKVEGKSPLRYHLIPHILYKGNIDTKGFEIISA